MVCLTLILMVPSCQSRIKTTQANGLEPVEPEPRKAVSADIGSSRELDRIMNELAESARTCRDIQLKAARDWNELDDEMFKTYRAALMSERAGCIELADILEQDPSAVDEACRLFVERVEKLDGEQARTFVALDDPDRLLRTAFGSEEAMLNYFNQQGPLLDSTDIYITCIKLGLAGVKVPSFDPLD